VYELRGEGWLRFLLAPYCARITTFVVLGLALLSLAVGWWLTLTVALGYFALVAWRGARLRIRADPSGVSVVNVFRSYSIPWSEVHAIWTDEEWAAPQKIVVGRRRGRLWAVDVHASLGLGAVRRRAAAFALAEVGWAHGYGFAAGDVDDLMALHEAGLLEETDATAHRAWWEERRRLDM